jgi:hypothetical protein
MSLGQRVGHTARNALQQAIVLARRTWPSAAILLAFVIGPALNDDDEWVSGVRLLSFVAGAFAGGIAVRRMMEPGNR